MRIPSNRNEIAYARIAVVLAVCASVVGCAKPATFYVTQPELPGRQEHLELTTEQAQYADRGDRYDVLLRFPLPGASTGKPRFIVYLSLPSPGQQEQVGYQLGPQRAARGFFYQAFGVGRGREIFADGDVWLRERSGGQWDLRLVGEGQLGTKIDGTARLSRDDFGVREYIERNHAGDVADLLAPPTITPTPAKSAPDTQPSNP